MLLLVLQADGERELQLGQPGVIDGLQQILDAAIDGSPIAVDFVGGRPADQTALRRASRGPSDV